jgi:putative membrane protein
MRHAVLLAAAAAAALSLGACQRKEPAPAAADAGTTNEAVNKAQDVTGAAVGAVSAATTAVTNSTEGFVTGLATSDMYEIQAGKIAGQKGQSAAVKAYGKQMVIDHTAMSNTMKPLFVAANEKIPTELDQRRKGMIDNLNAAAPADFDKTYLDQQEAAHEEALTLLKGYADGGDNADLKAAATKAIPKVQAHLDKAKELEAAPPATAAKK